MYRYLSIDITDNEASPQDVDGGTPPAKHTVEKCLEQFFRPEARELKCEKCEEGQEATQTMRILSTPKAMLLHLKRFVFVEKEMTFQKNKVRLGGGHDWHPTTRWYPNANTNLLPFSLFSRIRSYSPRSCRSIPSSKVIPTRQPLASIPSNRSSIILETRPTRDTTRLMPFDLKEGPKNGFPLTTV
jgi:hypothetical protein